MNYLTIQIDKAAALKLLVAVAFAVGFYLHGKRQYKQGFENGAKAVIQMIQQSIAPKAA